MYYFREVVDGQWKGFKFSDEEVDKIQRVTARKVIKAIAIVKDEVAKSGTTLTPAETLVVVQKVAPAYGDIAVDVLRKRSFKVSPQPAPVGAPAAAQAVVSLVGAAAK